MRNESTSFDVVVIGGGPGGASVATHLARLTGGALRIAVVERERFPRFRVGESLLPTCMLQFERLGVLDRIRAHGFQAKFGVSFHDQESGNEHSFFFRAGRPWPHETLDVARDAMDQILLEHAAAQPGVTLFQPASVEEVDLEAERVTVTVARGDNEAGRTRLSAGFLVDASGRDTFLASRLGTRQPMPGLGKVALFAYFRGAPRWEGRAEGNVRIYIFPDGWFWWIPLADDQTSVGCVMHGRVARERRGSVTDLLEEMIARCTLVRDGLRGAERVTPVYSAANFSYRVRPAAGDRHVCVGDAFTFVDPIFSAGVFVALESGELAAREIASAFREDRFAAERFADYELRLDRGLRPFCRMIEAYYDPSFLELFLQPKPMLGMVDAVTGVLAGGAFCEMPLGMRLSLEAFFAFVKLNRWRRRRSGRAIESRLEW